MEEKVKTYTKHSHTFKHTQNTHIQTYIHTHELIHDRRNN
jgi:hypothetical protein